MLLYLEIIQRKKRLIDSIAKESHRYRLITNKNENSQVVNILAHDYCTCITLKSPFCNNSRNYMLCNYLKVLTLVGLIEIAFGIPHQVQKMHPNVSHSIKPLYCVCFTPAK